MSCPCGSSKEYKTCCEPYILEKEFAPTAEALMRARYSAFVKHEEPFLRNSLAPEARKDYNPKEVLEWSKRSEWKGLQILKATTDQVEFIAKYKVENKVLEHHETAKFKKLDGKWYFVDGDSHVHEEGQGHHHHHEFKKPIVREEPKVGRNDPCSCGSGKKFKKCCGA